MVTWACLQILTSLCVIFVLKQKQSPDGLSSTPMTHQNENNSEQHNNEDAHDNETSLSNGYNETKEVNEKTRLTESESKVPSESSGRATNKETENLPRPASYGEVYGREIMKIPDFWLLMVTFIIGSSLNRLVNNNVGTYLRSFHQESHLHLIMTSAPWTLIITKIIIGTVSDVYRDKIPRLLFLVVVVVINAPSYGAFIFLADNIYYLYYITYVSFLSYGIFFVIAPVLVAEYFGITYFSINYGAAFLADGCFALLLQFILGLLYDMNVTDVATHTCYGLHCYYVSSGILCGLSLLTLFTSVILFVRRQSAGFK